MAFTEFTVDTSLGSNLHAGAPSGGIYPLTSTNGAYLQAGGAGGTDRFTASSGTPFSGISAADVTAGLVFVSVYLDAAAAPTGFVGRVTAFTGTTLDISLTAIAGTRPTTAASGVTVKVGGAWLGPTGASGFPFGFITAALTNAAGDYPRVNGTGTSNITAAMTHGLAGPVVFQGMTASPGDGGLWTIDGGTSGVSYTLLTCPDASYVLRDLIFQNNGATGQAGGVLLTGSSGLMERLVAHALRGGGITATGLNGILLECEAYGCNQANAVGGSGIRSANSSTCLRCLSHDNTGSNTLGFLLSNSATALDCIADSNGLDGFQANSSAATITLKGCDSYNNLLGAGLKIAGSTTIVLAENCNFLKSGTSGVDNAGSDNLVRLLNCAFGSGTQANTSGATSGTIEASGSITYAADVTPWVNPQIGDFRINLAAARNTGRGSFTQTQTGYAGTISYPDVGAAQHNTPTQPDADDVRLGVSYNDGLTTGTAAIPSASNVRFGTAVDAGAGTAYIPSAYDVRLGTNIDATAGTLAVPAASQVLFGIAVDHTTGTLNAPDESRLTVRTNADSYMSPEETLKRGDWRTFADLCSDDGTRLTRTQLLSDDNFATLLLDASGEVESAALVGGRYVPADLAALTGAGQGKLFRLIYRLAVVMGFERRPDLEMKLPDMVKSTKEDLELLAKGGAIFSFVETAEAGHQYHEVETARQIVRREGVVVQSERFWGKQPNRRDPRRQ